MGKIAIVFPGQGAQYKGMGLETAKNSSAASELFEKLDGIRPGTSKQCFEGTDEELKETKNTQPCIFAVEMATAAALREKGIEAQMAAGFSLGELSALTYMDVFSLEDGFRLVCERGKLMQEASGKADTFMAAVLKLSAEETEKICGAFNKIYPVNYNCPGQISVAGAKNEMRDFMKAVKDAGGRALPLKVSGAFHSPYMTSASEAFGELLINKDVGTPSGILYSNMTGDVYPDNIRETLAGQICSPVRWENIIRSMIRKGADTFIEAGPGSVLSGFIKKTDSSVKVYGESDIASLKKL